jgi:hypothetical protein
VQLLPPWQRRGEERSADDSRGKDRRGEERMRANKRTAEERRGKETRGVERSGEEEWRGCTCFIPVPYLFHTLFHTRPIQELYT